VSFPFDLHSADTESVDTGARLYMDYITHSKDYNIYLPLSGATLKSVRYYLEKLKGMNICYWLQSLPIEGLPRTKPAGSRHYAHDPQ
jgi:hypothetical protein